MNLQALQVGRLCSTALAMAVSTPAFANGRLAGGEALDVSVWRILAALVLCIIIAVLAVLMIRQRGGKVDLRALLARVELRPRAIDVVEARRLSQNADICVVRHDGREYLLLLLAGDARILQEKPIGDASGAEATAECD